MTAKGRRLPGGRVFICDLGYREGVPMVEHPPTDYVAHSEWADMMAETHEQRQCKGCGLWQIWEPKP